MTDPQRLSVTLTREFDAPIDLVFAAWTDAEHVSRWMKCDTAVDLRCDSWQPETGATFKTTMEKPGEWKVEGTGRFTEVDPPRVLAYASDADPQMNMPSMEVRVELEPLDGNRTRLTLTHSGIPNDDMCSVIQGGWTNSLAMLAELVTAKA